MDLEAHEQALLEKLRASSIRIPPRPQILHDIQKMLDDDNSTERMIGQLISRDVGLTAEVFKLANSPYYRRGAKIETVENAVRMLGRRTMGEIARNVLLPLMRAANVDRPLYFVDATHPADAGRPASGWMRKGPALRAQEQPRPRQRQYQRRPALA